MKCPNCGTPDAGPGPFCMACGVKLPPPSAVSAVVVSSQPSPVPSAPLSPAATPGVIPQPTVPPVSAGPLKTIRRISASSVFKVTLVVYALLFGIFGCPLLLVLASLGSLAGVDSNSMGSLLMSYILLVVLGALVPAVVWAIAAFIYNLIAKSVGGIQVELQE